MPCVRNDGRPIRLRFHRVWDEKVRDIAGGLTVLTPVKGKWVSAEGRLYMERMVPVRIACSEEQIHGIAAMTLAYYEQEAVFYYRVSDRTFLLNAKR